MPAATLRKSWDHRPVGAVSMRSYCALYIDAGYLLASVSIRVSGTSLRAATKVDTPGLISELVRQVVDDSALPLLRVNWYDAASGAVMSPEQLKIAHLAQVKMRLGRRGLVGEQKGVDLKLGLDLVTQARNRVADVIYLVSGDDDLTEAVEEARISAFRWWSSRFRTVMASRLASRET
jgi:hypothetical protein